MSVIRVNQITNRTNSGGPIISGLTTVGVVTSGVSIGVTNLYVEQINFGQTGILTAAVSLGTTDLYVSGTAFGNLTGDVTGDVTGNADTATVATTLTVGNEGGDIQCFPLFTTSATGNLEVKSNAKISFDSADGTLVATAFSGTQLNVSQASVSGVSTFTGNVDLNGGIDINGNTTGLNATGVSTFTGNVDFNGGIDINGNTTGLNVTGFSTFASIYSSGIVTATTFVGALTGTATTATKVTVADESSDTSCNVLFVTDATGDLAPKSGTNLTFNSSSGALTATSFVGSLTGNADTATTATNITLADESSDTTCFPVFATGATGNLAPKTGSNLTFNSSTGLLAASIVQGNNIVADATLRVGSATTTSMDLYVVGNSASGVHNLGSKSSSFAIDMSTGNNYNFTIAGNITLNNPTNTQPGQSGVIMITQDGTGSRTLAFQSHWNFVDGTAPTITAGAGTTSVLAYHVQDTDMIITTSVLALG